MFSANAIKKSYKSCGTVRFRCTDQRYNLHTLSVNKLHNYRQQSTFWGRRETSVHVASLIYLVYIDAHKYHLNLNQLVRSCLIIVSVLAEGVG